MQTALKFHSLTFGSAKTYLVAALFIVGNILLPQLAHLVPNGGVTWLPIYFFTLAGAYKYGWRVGLLTAIFSPVINSLWFGMPVAAMLPAKLLKSLLLAGMAGYAAAHFKKVSIVTLSGVVAGYQLIGTVGEWIMNGDFILACQDFRIGIPGMLLQIFGGYIVIKLIKD